VRVDEGLEASDRAIEIGERTGARALSASATLLRGVLLKLKGRLGESRDLLTRAYATADEDNDTLVAYYTVTNIADWTEGYVAGSGHLYRRELEKARFAARARSAPASCRTSAAPSAAVAASTRRRPSVRRQMASSAA